MGTRPATAGAGRSDVRCAAAVAAVAALCAALPLPAQDEPGTTSGRRSGTLPAAEYQPRPLRGFDVRVHPALLEGEHAEVGGRALDALARDLGDVLDQTPAARHGFLRSVPLFLGVADPVAPCACYHPSARWLERNGFDPAKARAVEITSARTYVDWRRHQPSMVLHELAHALHDQRLRPEQPRLEAALAAVRARGVYDRTLRWSGAEDRHYALNNVDEYFAEMALWFGVPSSDLELVLPNVRRFYDPASTAPPLGYLLAPSLNRNTLPGERRENPSQRFVPRVGRRPMAGSG